MTKYDTLVKSRVFNKIITPAKAGIQEFYVVGAYGHTPLQWTPVFTGETTFYENIKYRC